jgi:signal transduction histidine kinase
MQARTRELAKTVEDLEIASQHKNQFVANMSHELRTPLAAILGYAELMQEGLYEPLGQKSLGALTRIRSNGKHLLGLINAVLDIAKIESGQFTLNMSEYTIESVVETVRVATESLAQNKKLTLTTSVDKSLPVGLGDEQRLTQVLLNLVGNAIKFTDAGEVSIAAAARNGHFAVSVTDTGPGIPLDQQHRIFGQFHQVDSSNTKAKGGTGLGLTIAKQIVEMHGGRIWVVLDAGQRIDVSDGAPHARRISQAYAGAHGLARWAAAPIDGRAKKLSALKQPPPLPIGLDQVHVHSGHVFPKAEEVRAAVGAGEDQLGIEDR